MRVVVTSSHRFSRTPDSAVWTNAGFNYEFWCRYLDVFDGVLVVARIQEVPSVPNSWHRASGPSVNFRAVPYYVGPSQYVAKALQVRHVVRAAANPFDAVIFRGSGPTSEALLKRLISVGDLARSDVQAFLLYRLSPGPTRVDYEFAQGRTYLGGVSLIVPRWIWPGRPATKTTFGTEAQYGSGASLSRSSLSTRAYGLGGEGMLNFGPMAVPVLYGLYGALIGLTQRWHDRLGSFDSRLLLAPFVTILAFYFLTWDSDNIVVFAFKRGVIPIAVVVASSVIYKDGGGRQASE